VSTARSAQSQSIELHNPFEVRKQHLHCLSIFARLLVKASLGDGTSHIACGFMDAASGFANRRVWAAANLHRAIGAIELAGSVNDAVGFSDVRTRVFERAPVAAQRTALLPTKKGRTNASLTVAKTLLNETI
jgi:hypothetical protein